MSRAQQMGEQRAGSPGAAAAIWRWREASPAVAAAAWRARRRALRWEGVVRALVGSAVGGSLFYFGATILALVAGVGAGLVLLAALISPDGLYAAIGRGLGLLGHGIGRLLAVVLLTPLYWLVFVPFGRLLRGGRRDKLERWFDVAAPSYWHRREGRPRTKRSYERAF
ncbi:MAG: hypothetical protein KBI44_20705 [Thermoanaerobaculia bacterium]|nr:hypothetical protein [Thermoanaerobaculia bacterium]